MYKKIILATVITLSMQSSTHALDIGGLLGGSESGSSPLDIVGSVVQKGMEFKASKDEQKAAKKAEMEMKRTGKMPVVTEKKPSTFAKIAKMVGKKPAKKVAATPAPAAASVMPATPAMTAPKVVVPAAPTMPAPVAATPAPAMPAPVLTAPVTPAAGLPAIDPNKK